MAITRKKLLQCRSCHVRKLPINCKGPLMPTEKTFRCNECQKSFLHRPNLHYHQKNHNSHLSVYHPTNNEDDTVELSQNECQDDSCANNLEQEVKKGHKNNFHRNLRNNWSKLVTDKISVLAFVRALQGHQCQSSLQRQS